MRKLIASFFLLSVLSLPVCAMEYSTEYPSYLPISGGAYIEVQSTLGSGTLVFPREFQTDTFGFSGSSFNLFNLTNVTVSGRFYTASGRDYRVRLSAFSTLEYYSESSGWGGEWLSMSTSSIQNTNVRFIDNTTLTRAQESPVFDDGQRTMIPLLIVLLFVSVIGICLGVRKK